jgi:hypothetical protein
VAHIYFCKGLETEEAPKPRKASNASQEKPRSRKASKAAPPTDDLFKDFEEEEKDLFDSADGFLGISVSILINVIYTELNFVECL